MKQPSMYIMANKPNGTLYVGVTSNISRRVYEHKNKLLPSFTAKYDCTLLVYYETFDTMEAAIIREKQIKGGSRIKKLKLIESFNANWDDLYETMYI